MTRIAIIAALADELGPLVRGWRRQSKGGVDLWRMHRADGEWVAACAGIGVDAAARAFAEVERLGPVDLVVSAGWAGAMSDEYAVGRAYRVSGVVDANTGERFSSADTPGNCWLVTSRRVAGRAEKLRFAADLGAGLVDMEAAGVARLAAARGAPFLCVKGISDGLGGQLPDLNRFISEGGKFLTARFVAFAVLRPWHWPALARLGVDSRSAAESIGKSVREILEQKGRDAKRSAGE